MKSFNIGLILLLVGTIYLLDSLGVMIFGSDIHMPSLFGLWPLIPLVAGLNSLGETFGRYRAYKRLDSRRTLNGLFWTLVGGGFLLKNLDLWNWRVSTGDLVGPLILVWLGMQIISKSAPSGGMKHKHHHHVEFGKTGNSDNWNSFVGEVRIKEPWTLTDNTVNLWVGEIFVDVTKAFMPERNSHLEINALAGECTILIPKEVAIRVNTNLMAGEAKIMDRYEAGVFRSATYVSPEFETAEKRLVIDIKMKAGEITVRSV